MSVSITLKNIPDDVYRSLKAAAETHRRSLNGEAIVCLESVLAPRRRSADERLTTIRRLRAALPQDIACPDDVDALKSEGRE